MLSVGSIDKTKEEHKEKIAAGAIRGAMVYLRTEYPEKKFDKKQIMKQAWHSYNERKHKRKEENRKKGVSKKLMNRVLAVASAVGVMGAVGIFYLAALQAINLNKLESSINSNPGFVSVTTPYHSEKVSGKIYVNFNPNSVKSIGWKSEHGSHIRYNATKESGRLFSGQLNVMLKGVMKNRKSIRLWAQDVIDVELMKNGKTVEYLQSEIYNLNKRNNPIGFTKEFNKNITGAELYCTKVKFKCVGPTETYIYRTNPQVIGNQTRVTINQTLEMKTAILNGRACIIFSVRNNKPATKLTNFDKLCIGYKNKYKNVYVVVNHNNPEQLLMGGDGSGTSAVFSSDTKVYLEIPNLVSKGKIVKLHYNLGVSNESAENSNLWVAEINKDTGVVKLIPKGN